MQSLHARLKSKFRKRFGKSSAMNSSIMEFPITSNSSKSPLSRWVSRGPNTHKTTVSPTTAESSDPISPSNNTKQRLFWGGSRRKSQVARESRLIRPKDQTAANSKKKSVSGTLSPSNNSNISQIPTFERPTKLSKKSGPSPTNISASASKENVRPFGKKRPNEESKGVKFKPASIVLGKKVQVTARCSAAHDGRKILQERLRVQVDALFGMLFSPSPFLQGFHDRRKSTDLQMGTWSKNAQGQEERLVKMTVALHASVGPKSAKVTETQVMRDCSKPGQLYSIDVHSTNAEIPYADTFEVRMHYCLKATVDEHTDVLVFAEVKFLKSVWAVVKTFIEKNAYAGIEEFCQSLYSALLNDIKKK